MVLVENRTKNQTKVRRTVLYQEEIDVCWELSGHSIDEKDTRIWEVDR